MDCCKMCVRSETVSQLQFLCRRHRCTNMHRQEVGCVFDVYNSNNEAFLHWYSCRLCWLFELAYSVMFDHSALTYTVCYKKRKNGLQYLLQNASNFYKTLCTLSWTNLPQNRMTMLHLSSSYTILWNLCFFMVGICYQLSRSTVYSPIFTCFLCICWSFKQLSCEFFLIFFCSILTTKVVPPTPVNAHVGGVGKYCRYEVGSHWLTVIVRHKYIGYSSWPGIVFIV